VRRRRCCSTGRWSGVGGGCGGGGACNS
jgi:hypothetical protein